MKNNFITKIIGATLAFAMMIGGAVGINAAKEAKEANADDEYISTITFNSAPTSGNTYSATQNDPAKATYTWQTDSSYISADTDGDYKAIHTGSGSYTCSYQRYTSSSFADYLIKSVKFRAKSNGSNPSCSVTINGESVGSQSLTNAYQDLTITNTNEEQGGDLVVNFSINNAKKNIMVSYVEVTYGAAGGGQIIVKETTETTITAPNNKDTLDLALTPTDTVQLSASVTYESGTVNNPSIAWTSSNTDVATVSQNGLVTAVAKGNTTITANYAGDETYAASSAQKVIHVINSTEAVFDFAAIAAANSWNNGTAYTPVVVGGVTLAGNGGGNNAKYYESDHSWRMYTGGSILITPPSGKSIASVTSAPERTFVLASGGTSASLSITANTNFTNITVALAEEKIVDTISASLTNTSRVWRTNDTVTASDLTVVPHFTDGTDGTPITDGTGVTVTNGTLQIVGSNTVNVSFGGKSTTVTVNALSSTIVEWTLTGEIGETVKGSAYNLSGLTLHGYYDNGKTDEASSSVMNAYGMIANPSSAGPTPDPDNTIEVKVYANSDTGHTNCLHTFENVPAPIANYPKGTENNPYNVAEARNAIDTLTTVSNAYVSGIISKIDGINSGAITYWISDDGTTTNQLEAYKGKNIGGVNFSATTDIEVGASVTITGTLKKYNSIYEFDQNNALVSYTAPTNEWRIKNILNSSSSFFSINGLENRSSTIEPESIVFANLGLKNNTQYADPFNGGHFTITFGGGANDGKYYTTGSGIRTYGDGTITIASDESITQVEFTWSDDSNKPDSGTVANVGTYVPSSGTWTGTTNSLVLTRPSGSGHWRLQSVTVSYGAFESVSDVKLRFGASIPTEKWDAINNLQDCEITDYGVMLYKTKAQYAETAPTVQARYAANHSYVATFNKGSGVAPTAEDGKYTFTARIDYTDETEYSKYIIAQAFIVVNGTDYYFLGEEMRESVRTLAGKANVETNLSSDALTYLTTAGN